MRLYSVVVLGPKVREVLNCQKRTKLEAIDHGKEFVDGWVAFQLQLDRIKVVIEEAKIKAGVPASQPRKESRNTRCARRIAARIKQAKQ